ncbi:uncharacterized protein LOC110679851 isoform X1 [Aedes aegypti]|uniref:SWIM-type domain-containing protein n=2 Tax=Aedes aegypti TaxID=7159 RepID=A0A6I8U4C3_AEDAE|nr:uncharacterized protein LOC110679850 isoform X1 [Aedes aegypti]XP_021711431.1 uncharacterized protein LOC110679851 isoform X1 [Aedes aegypti]
MQQSDLKKCAPDVELEVTIVDILDYVGESVRPIKEGYAVYAANHVICIGYRQQDAVNTEVTGYVTQTSHPGLAPHEVFLKLQQDISKWTLKCSCKAGTAKCKHIVACLLHIEKHPKLEYLSCTDVKQAWGMTKSRKPVPWRAKRIKDLCCVTQPYGLPCSVSNSQTEEEILSTSFNRILSVSKQSAIFKHIEGRFLNELKTYPNRALQNSVEGDELNIYITEEELTRCLNLNLSKIYVQDCNMSSFEQSEYYKNYVNVDITKVIRIALETRDQSTNDWKIHRTKRITASSAYKLFTYLKNKNPDWGKKIEQYWDIKGINVKATKYGKDTEQLAYDCYKKNRNPLVKKCGLVVHPNECWIAGSPDGVDVYSQVLLEIKCPGNEEMSLADLLDSAAVRRYIKNSTTSDIKLSEQHMYYCQIQINMWILNCITCDFII